MRVLFVFICIYNFLFAIEQKEFMLNNIKSLIQKEEYLSLAINKYILQTGTIPKNGTSLDWDKLMTDEYLGINFDKTNPYTNKELVVSFTNNHMFIKGLIEKTTDYKNEHKYLYNLYTDSKFRVNTIAPKTSQSADILLGTQVLYGDLQKEIAKILFDSKKIFLENATCTKNSYFYELANQKLTYKYCKSDGTKLTVYQDPPIYLNSDEDLKIVKANIGDTAFVEQGTEILEYYFHSEQVNDNYWVKVQKPKIEKLPTTLEDYKNKILTYIPNAKDIYIRQSSGCYLANGDIYCWGKNDYKKAGIENYGQLDITLKPDYINTPIMLKTQIDNPTENTVTYDIKSKNWYNSPFRVKFDKIGVNSTNVCGITKIFSYTDAGVNYKIGGDLYCNGLINQLYFENISADIINTSILSKNKYFGWGKSDKKDDSEQTIKISQDGGPVEKDASGVELSITRDEIYLTDIAMVEDAIAILDDKGKIYTIGKNYKGALGVDKTDYFYYANTPVPVVASTTIIFKKIFALRDSRTFGAIDSNNQFYIWGDRGTSIIHKPTLISNTKFNPDAIFVNTNEFILKGTDEVFYKTNGSVVSPVSSTAITGNPLSLSYYKDNTGKEYWLYIDENQQLKGTESLLTCKKQDGTACNTTTEAPLFNKSLDKLNTPTTTDKIDYSKFTNVSIFKLDHQISEIVEDFESNWNKLVFHDGGSQATRFLGMFANDSNSINFLNKTYNFGIENAGKEVTINLDFYEIDYWDSWHDKFTIYVNDEIKHSKGYQYSSTTEGGIPLVVENYSSAVRIGEKHKISVTGKLDNYGKIKLGFSSTLLYSSYYESWGIDNIELIRNNDNKLLSFEDFETKIYEDWNRLSIHDGGTDSTKFLGRWSYGSSAVDYVNKTYDFGIEKAGHNVTVELNLYEIDTWDGHYFRVYLNGEEKYNKYFWYLVKEGSSLVVKNYPTDYPNTNYSERHKISVTGKLDSRGRLRVGFSSTLDESIQNESWGVDNIKITDTTDSNKLLFLEDFENKWNNEWNKLSILDGGAQATNFLGRWSIGSSGVDYVNKTYDFGIVNKDLPVIIKLDFYEIDSWDNEYFSVYVNGVEKSKKQYYQSFNNGGTPLIVENYASGYRIGEKIKIEVEGVLDSTGKIRLGFSSTLDEILYNESWGVDNIEIYKKSDNSLLGKEDFEKNVTYVKSSLEGWSNNKTKEVIDNGDTSRVPATTFLGNFPIVDCQTGIIACNGKPFEVSKKYSFGSLYANYEVDIEFDFYEIDSWDGERFEFYANDTLLAVDHFVKDGHYSLVDSNITGIPLQKNVGIIQSENPQKYPYKLRSKLNSNGEVTLKFKTNWEYNSPYVNYYSKLWYVNPYYEDVNNESWGIDNIKIKLKETDKTFVCAMTGVEQNSQMYCWGNVARSLPILNTSLYDSDKISSLNKLFLTQSQDINKQMSFDAYDESKNGMLFLKYPTYINGFDYPFYFK